LGTTTNLIILKDPQCNYRSHYNWCEKWDLKNGYNIIVNNGTINKGDCGPRQNRKQFPSYELWGRGNEEHAR
jgi:hypothetical protein